MKKAALLLIAICCCTDAAFAQIRERFGVKGPWVFNNTGYILESSEAGSEHYFVQEYLPAGQQFDSYTEMMSIYVLESDISVSMAMLAKVAELDERKKTDPVCHYKQADAETDTDWTIDFLMSSSTGNSLNFVEFNVYHYHRADIGHGKKGMVLYCYTKRAYGNDIKPFLTDLSKERQLRLSQMKAAKMPAVTLTK